MPINIESFKVEGSQSLQSGQCVKDFCFPNGVKVKKMENCIGNINTSSD